MICPHCGEEIHPPKFNRSKNRIIEEIKKLVCEILKVKQEEIYTRIRTKEIVKARHVIGYFLTLKEVCNLNDVATCFGDAISDHTTVVNGNRKIKNYLSYDVDFIEQMEYLEERVNFIINPLSKAV